MSSHDSTTATSNLLRGATLLHLDPPGTEKADLRIQQGRITEIAPSLKPLTGESVEDLSGSWLMPGLVVGHHHLYSALACGMPLPSSPPPTFADMLAQVWWKLDRALDEDAVQVSALVGGVGALRAGVTTIVDHHASPNFIQGSLECIDEALGQLGLRRILCYEVTDRGGAEKARQGIEAHKGLMDRDGAGMMAVMVGGHANFTMSDATLSAAAALARDAGSGLHIHMAEAPDDRQTVGEELVARMERLGALLPGSLLAHCVHLEPDDLRRIADAGAWVSHQPRSNMNNAVGHAPLSSFGENTILGTDGIGSDMLAELQAGYFRAQEAGDPWFPDRFCQALSASAVFAGEKLGVDLGHIQKGAQADLVVMDPVPGPPLSAANLPAALVFRFSSSMVRHVMVAGSWRLRHGMPVGLDVAGLDERARWTALDVWRRFD